MKEVKPTKPKQARKISPPTGQTKRFSQACENNKHPILKVLRKYVITGNKVLEIGSGTGQHAVLFAEQLPNISWQPSDLLERHSDIKAWISSTNNSRVLEPIELDVKRTETWPHKIFNCVFTANTTHILSWHEVILMIELASSVLPSDGYFIIYGPFNVGGEFTNDSNKTFDQHLKSVRISMGLRDVDEISAVAKVNHLLLVHSYEMPVNNKILVFKRKKS